MSTSKAAKAISFTATAQDQIFKIKNLMRWLKAGHEVRVQINGKADRQKSMEGVMKEIEREVKNGADVKQKVIKPESIKFSLRPTKNAVNLQIDELASTKDDIAEVEDMTIGKDVFSDDFEKELERSINEERSKNKRK